MADLTFPRPTVIAVRGMFIRLGDIEISIREDGALTIVTRGPNPARMELSQADSEVLASIIRMISRD